MDWNNYLAKAYKALDNAHLHFNVEDGTFEFDDDKDARQGAIILSRLYGFGNVIQSGFNVIVCEPEDLDKDEPIQLDSDKIKLTDLEPEDLKYAGVKEDIEKHDELNPKLFEGNELKEDVKEALLKVVDAFVEDLKDSEVDIKVKDAIIIGSNANYNYTKDSDIDLHIIADSKATKYPGELLTLLYSAYRSIFNKNYTITIKGIPCEVYVEVDELQANSNGVYSLYNGWIKEPEQKSVPDLDEEAFNKLFNEWEDRYFALLDDVGITEDEILALNY